MSLKNNKKEIKLTKKNKIFLFLFLFLILGLNLGPKLTEAVESKDARILELRKKIEALEKEAEQYKNEIENRQGEAQTLKNEIGNLNSQIKKIETEIKITSSNINSTKIEIDSIGNEIVGAEIKMVNEEEALKRIITTIDKDDKENLLSVLMKNNELSDFFNQVQYRNNIQEQLIATLNILKETRIKLQEEKTSLEIKKNELQELGQEFSARKSSLDNVKGTKSVILKRTKGEEAKFQELLSETEKKRIEFFSELQLLEKEVVESGMYLFRSKVPVPSKGAIFQWPEEGGRLTQSYGYTSFAKKGSYGGKPHSGIDVSGGYGTPIRSIGDGQVLMSDTSAGWGNWVAVRHDNGLVSVYAHMMKPSHRSNGEDIKAGDIIGYEGSTGYSTGSHVHLSLYNEFFTYERNDRLYFNYIDGTIDPLDYIKRP